MEELSQAEVAKQLRALGVRKGGVLLVHTSFRAVRPIEDGPAGLIEALRAALGPDGTLVMPSWTGNDDEPFDPATTPASPDLGVVPDSFWRLPGVIRSAHPFACAAAGPEAARITSGGLPLPPHVADSPVGRVYQLDGQVLLLGVGHDADTTLHLAELLAGVPYRVPKHCTVLQDGRAVRIEYGENDLRRRAGRRRGGAGTPGPRPAPVSPSCERRLRRVRRGPKQHSRLMFQRYAAHDRDHAGAVCSVGTETLLARIDQLGSAIARVEAAAAGSSPARRRVEE